MSSRNPEARASNQAGHARARSKSSRWQLTPFAKAMLEAAYDLSPTPTTAQRDAIATQLNATSRQVQVWFQNKRQRSSLTHKQPAAVKPLPLPEVYPTPAQPLMSSPPSSRPSPPASVAPSVQHTASPTLSMEHAGQQAAPTPNMRRNATVNSLADLADFEHHAGAGGLPGGLQPVGSFQPLGHSISRASISRASSFRDLGALSHVGSVSDLYSLGFAGLDS